MSLSVHFCNFAIIISVASTKISWLIIGHPLYIFFILKNKKINMQTNATNICTKNIEKSSIGIP